MLLATIRHIRVRANGVEFHVALSGRDDAPLLLCLHGFPESWYSWRHQLNKLADRYLVVAPDLRGYGETEKPTGGYDLRNLAADAIHLIRAFDRSHATLLGHDWGGLIAYAAAAYDATAIDRLIVLNAPHPRALVPALASFDQIRRSWYIFAIQLPWLFDWRLARNEAAILPRIFMAGAKRRSMFQRDDLEFLRRSFARPGVVSAALKYYRVNLSLMGLLRGRTTVPIVGPPTLVLYGRDDPFVGAKLFHNHERFFRGPYEIRSIPDCGHWTQQEVPEVVNEALRTFA